MDITPAVADDERQLRGRGRRRRDPTLEAFGSSGRRPVGTLPNASLPSAFRFALATDTHLWPASPQQRASFERSEVKVVKDGLLVSSTPEIVAHLFKQLAQYAATGGAFGVHLGDSVCGGASFGASSDEFKAQLAAAAAAERVALPRGWLHHMPGNHDLDPEIGGLESWHATMGNSSGAPHPKATYRALRPASGWRMLLLDSASPVEMGLDTNGRGHIQYEQMRWLSSQLDSAAAAAEQVILMVHQLLVPPSDGYGGVSPWFVPEYDLVDNAHEVLALLRRHAHVRLVLHGHCHANSITLHNGVAFVTTASASEYPMHWREVVVRNRCEIELRTRSLDLPALRERSARRDTRGFNEAKLGSDHANRVVLRSCKSLGPGR